jgi:tRNA(Ile2) C34 agmatinyltransferase TiaS
MDYGLDAAEQPRCEACGTVMYAIGGGYRCRGCGYSVDIPHVEAPDAGDLPGIGGG